MKLANETGEIRVILLFPFVHLILVLSPKESIHSNKWSGREGADSKQESFGGIPSEIVYTETVFPALKTIYKVILQFSLSKTDFLRCEKFAENIAVLV